ncbi:hypothetical protein SAMN02799630_00875 [Paenibacillus sp. UNCCL117]|uniref:hypothetical protein n=1 Tax=unclassified Paenibacillus TaxID=185978 RepID=UPI000885EA75|nr:MULTISPECIES: hypothetical protein [unclassified Paenibacillus]SDC23679.1 hypothetical protein SAMN04488602_101675 [Paenibacillus sp. cl123]SFW19355.1 hypothetical protein SAMN02799630_00875 [Paenibacillus sp. UNCCL117]
MSSVMIRPDLKTAGGEVCDVLYNNRFAGTLTIVYREAARLAGSLQLEREMLSDTEKEEVFRAVHDYVQAFSDSIDARECEIMATYSSFDHVITAQPAAEFEERGWTSTDEDFDYDTDWIDHDANLEDEGAEYREDYSMGGLELVLVSEDEDLLEYHIYDEAENWLAEAFLHIEEADVTGSVHWLLEPEEEALDTVADLLVLDFDEDEIDTFVIHMMYDNEVIETIELTHEQLLPDSEEAAPVLAELDEEFDPSSDYSVVLARDDGDVLTYEIYQQSHGGLPIGWATVDISQRQLTGFIDFREPGSEGDRELIATLLMEELDKEKDYEAINLSMMHRNRLIEEVLFETEQVH